MTTTRIREETSADIQRVHQVEAAAFGQELQAVIVDSLRVSAHPQLSLVATADIEGVVGHIFFSPSTVASDPAFPVAQLSPLAVLPSFQKQGIGSSLVRDGLQRCTALGWKLVFLLGDPRYYSRFGFIPASRHGFELADKGPVPALQVYELESGALDGHSGAVRFHPAFDLAETAQ